MSATIQLIKAVVSSGSSTGEKGAVEFRMVGTD